MTPLSRDDLEALSAYLDGALSQKERAALESRLAAELELRTALDELRRTVQILRAAPRVAAPRNYTLDPARYARPAPWWARLDVFRTMGMLGAAAATALIVVGVLLGSFGAWTAGAPMASSSVAMQASHTAAPAADAVGQSAAAPAVMATSSPMPTSTPAAVRTLAIPAPLASPAPFATPSAVAVGEDGQSASRQADSAAAGGMVAPTGLAPGALPPSPGEALEKPTQTALANYSAQTLVGEAEAPTAPEAGAALMGEGSPALSAQATPAAMATGLPTPMMLRATAELLDMTAPSATSAKSAPPPAPVTGAVEENAASATTATASVPPTSPSTPTSAALAVLPTGAPATERPEQVRAAQVENPLPRLLIVAGLGLLVVSAVTWLIGRARGSRP